MDSESFEQITMPQERVKDALRWCAPSSEVEILFIDEQPTEVQLPSAVDLEVTQTGPGLRGDSVTGGGTKPATLETGAVIQVPLFLEQGQRIRVDTRSGDYIARA
jgi:elongation factor P